ncbi:UNVERIFIED_CONTAM: hypothetical protein NCL1_05091 [Trichonephila clavipes]
MRRAFHGRDLENPEPRQNCADARHGGGLFAGRGDYARGHRRNARAVSGGAGGQLCQHDGSGEGGLGHLLHLGQCGADRAGAAGRYCHHGARQVSGAERGAAGAGKAGGLVGRGLYRPRTLYRAGSAGFSRVPARYHHHRPSRMSARCGGGGGLYRLYRGHH